MDNYYGSPYNHWDYQLFKDVKPFHIKNKKRGFLASLGNGRNVVGLSVPVILITTQGLFLQRTVTNQEGFFRFRRVPLDLSVLVIAVDTTYKYNAVVFANIKTLESNYDQSEV